VELDCNWPNTFKKKILGARACYRARHLASGSYMGLAIFDNSKI
jgi:hypothetical protein